MPLRTFSDDSKAHCGGGLFNIVVAGVVLGYDTAITDALVGIELRSKKGTRSWSSTRDPEMRSAYLDAVLALPELRGKVFFGAFMGVSPRLEDTAREDVLFRAITAVTGGRKEKIEIVPEGLSAIPRRRLERALRARGVKKLKACSEALWLPETRLTDALSGAIRERLAGSYDAVLLDLPDWFLNVTEGV